MLRVRPRTGLHTFGARGDAPVWRLADERRERSRRGSALVGVLIALILVMAVVLGVIAMGKNASESTFKSVQGKRALFAAEAAAHAAVRELYTNADLDNDGTVGSISNDANTANDPTTTGGTRLWATKSVAGSTVTITARGQNADATRAIEIQVSTGSGSGSGGSGGSTLFFTRESSAAVRYSAFNSGTQTWGTASTSGTLSSPPIWCAAAISGSSTLVLTSDSDKALRYGLANSSGVASYSSLVGDLGTSNERPFDVGVEPTSGEGLIVYYDKNAGGMRSRTVVSGTLSSAASMGLSTSDVHWARLVPLAPSGNELMALTIDGSEVLRAARWTGSAWTGQTTLHSSITTKNAEGMAGAVEAQSGRLVVAYSDASDNRVGYRIFTPGSGWSSNTWINGFDAKVYWLRLIAQPSSNQIMLAASNDVGRLRTSRWNGTSWTTPVALTDNVGGTNMRHFDLHVSPDGSDVLIMYGKGGGTLFYRLWTGSAWSNEATAFALSSGTVQVVLARPGPSPQMLVGVVGDSNGGANAWSWNGTSFGAVSRVGTTGTSFKEFEWFAIPTGTSGTSTTTITGWSMIAP